MSVLLKCLSVWALIGSRDEAIPINYTKIAASKNNVDMVSLFASLGVSQSNLVEALEQAVEQNLPNIVLALLKHGVDPNSRNGSTFESAIASQNPALVKLLLRSRLKIRQDMLTRNLPVAVEKQQTEIVSLLILHGADTRFENASALRKAVQAQRVDLVLAIMKGVTGAARSDIASSVFVEAFSPSSALSVPEQRLLIDILLCAGAKGDPVAQIIAPAVRASRRDIIGLLVKHGVNLHYNNAEALRLAVATDKLDILSKLLVGNVSREVASSLVDGIPHTVDNDRMFRFLSLLIDKGARGPPLDQALLRAVQRNSTRIISLLLDHHARVDVEDSQPLRMAVTNGDLATLNLLLAKGRPQPKAMQLLLPLVPPSSPQLRSDMTKSIISAAGQEGIPTPILSDALIQALRHPLHEVDQYLIPLADVLILAGASVDCQRGKCFRRAVELGSMGLLELLIHYMSEPVSLLSAVPVCMKMNDYGQRQKFVTTLLKHGAKGLEVDQALIDAIEDAVPDEALIMSLLEKANLEYHEGRALSAAMRFSPVNLVAAIIDTGRTSQKSRFGAGQILLEPATKERQSKLHLLLRAGVGQDGVDNALIREIDGERDSEVVRMLLDHKASCAFDGGRSLGLAIRHQDNEILKQLVARSPDRSILGEMIPKASNLRDPVSRRTSIDILIKGGATGERVSHALVDELENPDRRDHRIIQLLVASGARIDYSNGRAIKFAVSTLSNADILRILVSGTAAAAVLESLIPLAMAHRQKPRLPLLHILLENGACGDQVDAALVTAVTEGPKAQPTLELLLKYKASVDYDEAAAMKIAARAGSSCILELLLSRNPNPEHFEEALNFAMQSPSSTTQAQAERLHLVRLLTRSKTPGPGHVNLLLVQAVQEGDCNLVEYLINCEANPNFKDGQSIVIATQQLDIRSLHLLARSKNKPVSFLFCERTSDHLFLFPLFHCVKRELRASISITLNPLNCQLRPNRF